MFTFVFLMFTFVNVNKINMLGGSVLKGIFEDKSYDQRKILNAPDVIKAIKQMGYSYDQIGDICGVSKTMVSRWGKHNDKSAPTKQQLLPILNEVGRGRIMCDVEVLSPAARQFPPIYSIASVTIALSFFLAIIWVLFIEPCSSNFEVCGKLPWYEKLTFGRDELKERLELIKQCGLVN
ncbi:hypothetical protein HJ202_23985 [Vibrio parahaemolyticus]|uniref:hypothetical protein n=1 Tax=Vibrio parahaemolyticus TaxID=670 RepID=UPI001E4EBBB3|nr:hypothetical protein [Vibrio parahaemolyticus]MBE3723350.1 hypothetical protein [Vibrio parahaemolyticus]HCE3221294.1 hypothetical protein [Vibrio parahaemolyticus]HCG6123139.1 hypothetical protein [Vibrio parahaemolyticus]HCG6989341.1 hypothetical protein [Vibrio parahaemolyticus]HCG8217500.1 hypothetical protein [Vibrio parahaemolyticus]